MRGTTFERMKTVLIDAGIPEKAIRTTLRDVCKVSYQAVAGWEESPNTEIGIDKIDAVAERFKVSLRWLATGKGAPFGGDAAATNEALTASTFALRLRNTRLARNYTQPQLAELCGWEHQSRISGYERETREPSGEDILKLAAVLKVDPGDLFFGADRPGAPAISEDEAQWLRLYKALPQAIQPVAMQIVSALGGIKAGT